MKQLTISFVALLAIWFAPGPAHAQQKRRAKARRLEQQRRALARQARGELVPIRTRINALRRKQRRHEAALRKPVIPNGLLEKWAQNRVELAREELTRARWEVSRIESMLARAGQSGRHRIGLKRFLSALRARTGRLERNHRQLISRAHKIAKLSAKHRETVYRKHPKIPRLIFRLHDWSNHALWREPERSQGQKLMALYGQSVERGAAEHQLRVNLLEAMTRLARRYSVYRDRHLNRVVYDWKEAQFYKPRKIYGYGEFIRRVKADVEAIRKRLEEQRRLPELIRQRAAELARLRPQAEAAQRSRALVGTPEAARAAQTVLGYERLRRLPIGAPPGTTVGQVVDIEAFNPLRIDPVPNHLRGLFKPGEYLTRNQFMRRHRESKDRKYLYKEYVEYRDARRARNHKYTRRIYDYLYRHAGGRRFIMSDEYTQLRAMAEGRYHEEERKHSQHLARVRANGGGARQKPRWDISEQKEKTKWVRRRNALRSQNRGISEEDVRAIVALEVAAEEAREEQTQASIQSAMANLILPAADGPEPARPQLGTVDWHEDRNLGNELPTGQLRPAADGAPDVFEDDAGRRWKRVSEEAALLHQPVSWQLALFMVAKASTLSSPFTSKHVMSSMRILPHVKFVSENDDRVTTSEIVVDRVTGRLVTNMALMGTLNYANAKESQQLYGPHLRNDVVPHLLKRNYGQVGVDPETDKEVPLESEGRLLFGEEHAGEY